MANLSITPTDRATVMEVLTKLGTIPATTDLANFAVGLPFLMGHVSSTDPADWIAWWDERLPLLGLPPFSEVIGGGTPPSVGLGLYLLLQGLADLTGEVHGWDVAETTIDLDGSGEGTGTVPFPETGRPRPFSLQTVHVGVGAPGAALCEVFLNDTFTGNPFVVPLNAAGNGQTNFTLYAPMVPVDQLLSVRCTGAVDGVVNVASAWRPFTKED